MWFCIGEFCLKSVETFQFWLKSEKSDGYFIWTRCVLCIFLFSVRHFRHKTYGRSSKSKLKASNPIEQRPSWGADSFLSGHELSALYGIRKLIAMLTGAPPPGPILGRLGSVHTLTPYFQPILILYSVYGWVSWVFCTFQAFQSNAGYTFLMFYCIGAGVVGSNPAQGVDVWPRLSVLCRYRPCDDPTLCPSPPSCRKTVPKQHIEAVKVLRELDTR
jgi:hypothetical protein